MVHVGTPGEAGGLFPGALPEFHLFRTCFLRADSWVLRGRTGVQDAHFQVFFGHDQEHVENLARGGFDTGRGHQGHLLERLGGLAGHLRREPAAQRKAQYVDPFQAQLLQRTQIPTGQVADAHNPVQPVGDAKPGMGRQVESGVLGQRFRVAKGGGPPHLVVKHQ